MATKPLPVWRRERCNRWEPRNGRPAPKCETCKYTRMIRGNKSYPVTMVEAFRVKPRPE